MNNVVIIKKVSPGSAEAQLMSAALWEEIQSRYGFEAPNPFDAASFAAGNAGFWIARDAANKAVGSIAVAPLNNTESEIDMMYVSPGYRGCGIAQKLMAAAVKHAKENNFTLLKLRAGAPQPEALRFYEKEGFTRIPAFGKWVDDSTAICFEKKIG